MRRSQLFRLIRGFGILLVATPVAWGQDQPKTDHPGSLDALELLVAPRTIRTDQGHEYLFVPQQFHSQDLANLIVKLTAPAATSVSGRALELHAKLGAACASCHQTQTQHDVLYASVHPNAPARLGVSGAPATSSLRAQLRLPEKSGFVVNSVVDDSIAAKAGVKQHDVILKLGDDAINSAESLEKSVASVKGEVKLEIVRDGVRKTLKVNPAATAEAKPAQEVMLRLASSEPTYWIGVQLGEVEEALRSQLKLEAGHGLVVSTVIKDGPAEKAGLKVDDVLIKIGDDAITSNEILVKGVQATKGEKSLKLGAIRGGKPVSIEVKPEPRKDSNTYLGHLKTLKEVERLSLLRPGVLVDPKLNALALRPHEMTGLLSTRRQPANVGGNKDLKDLEKQVKDLSKQVEELSAAVKSLREASKR